MTAFINSMWVIKNKNINFNYFTRVIFNTCIFVCLKVYLHSAQIYDPD